MEIEIQLLSSTGGIDCDIQIAYAVTLQISINKTGADTLFSIFYQD